jgi:hypothetical protein
MIKNALKSVLGIIPTLKRASAGFVRVRVVSYLTG